MLTTFTWSFRGTRSTKRGSASLRILQCGQRLWALKGREIKKYKKNLVAHLRREDRLLSLRDISFSDVVIDDSSKITGHLTVNFHDPIKIEIANRAIEAAKRYADAHRVVVKIGDSDVLAASVANKDASQPRGISTNTNGSNAFKR